MLSSPNLENSNFNTNAIHKDIAAMTPTQRYAFEQRLEDEYVSGELSWSSKKKDILHTCQRFHLCSLSTTAEGISNLCCLLEYNNAPSIGKQVKRANP